MRYFLPQALLQQALELLSDESVMLIVNQGQQEAEEQQELFNAANIKAESLGEISRVFSPFKKALYGWVIRK